MIETTSSVGEGTDSSPALPAWLRELEQIHQSLTDLVLGLQAQTELAPDVEALKEQLTLAFRLLYAAMNQTEEPSLSVRQLDPPLRALESLFTPHAETMPIAGVALELLQSIQARARRAEQLLLPREWKPDTKLAELTASQGVPKAHHWLREAIPPSLNLVGTTPADVLEAPPPIPNPSNFAELEQAVQALRDRAEKRRAPAAPSESDSAPESTGQAPSPLPGFHPDPLPAPTPTEYLQQRARECFEDVVMLLSQRTPMLGESWHQMRFIEQRLLANVDAFAALGQPALSALEPLVSMAPTQDPALLAGTTLIAGCIEGRDALAIAERLFLTTLGQGPEFSDAFATTLKLVPHASLSPLLHFWLESPDPDRRALALDVLTHRGLVTAKELECAVGDDPKVSRCALPWLGFANHPRLPEFTEDALQSSDEGLKQAAWLAMILGNQPRAVPVLSAAVGKEHEDTAALLLALFGERHEAEYLLSQAQQRPRAALAYALGWTGLVNAIPMLIAWLQIDDEAIRGAAAQALERITAAGLTQIFELPPEATMAPDIPTPDTGDAEAQAPHHAEEPSSDGSPDTVELPETRFEIWQAYWMQYGGNFDPQKRYRMGQPYSPLVLVDELSYAPRSPRERRFIQIELVIRTGEYVRFDPLDFVPVQLEAIEAWRPIALRASGSPGSFTRAARRTRSVARPERPLPGSTSQPFSS